MSDRLSQLVDGFSLPKLDLKGSIFTRFVQGSEYEVFMAIEDQVNQVVEAIEDAFTNALEIIQEEIKSSVEVVSHSLRKEDTDRSGR